MKLKLNRYEAAKAFRSVSHFAEFADGQAASFSKVQSVSREAHGQWANHFHGVWRQAAATARAPEATEQSIQAMLNSTPAFCENSNFFDRLMVLSKEGRGEAVKGVVGVLKGIPDGQRVNNSTTMGLLHGQAEIVALLAVESLLSKPSTRRWLNEIIQEHEDRFNQLLDSDEISLSGRLQDFSNLMVEAENQHESLAKNAAETMAKHKSDWEQARHDYLEQLKTETAVELWSNRAASHKTSYHSFRKWAVGVGLGGLVLSLVWIFAGFAFVRFIFPEDATAQVSSYVAGSIVIFTIFVWGLRVLVRSMMSEDHLSTDASVRSAMAHTYLALIKQGAATDDDRTIILASLFSPVSDGIVKDDGMPVLSPTALAAHALTNPKP